MSMKISMTLDQVWSITDAGWLCVETVPKGQTSRVFGEFTFDDETILESLEEDIGLKRQDPTYDITDWVNLKHNLAELSESIGEKLDEAFG